VNLMTKVECNNSECLNNKKGICGLDKIQVYTGAIGYEWSFVECRSIAKA